MTAVELRTPVKMILGLTIGVSTIGWALLDDKKIVAQGVRAFPTSTTGDIESGRDAAKNVGRRDARQRRTQLRRRAGRLRRLFRLLQNAGWLPEGTDRHAVLEGFKDSPYAFRTRALDEKIEPYDLGRVVYHMAHRRGFKAGQKLRNVAAGSEESSEKKKKIGIITQAILDLEEAIRVSGLRTLGEYLHSQPTQRCRWTSRAMYVTELDAILTSQARFHSISAHLRAEITKVIFDQKALKSQKGRVGRCLLERSKRRMLLAHPRAQEFRIWQQVNDLRAVDDLGADTVVLTLGMRQQLAQYLSANGDATFAEIRKVLGVPRTVRFNFERADKRMLVGDRTREAIGAAYSESLAEDLLSIAEEAGLRKRLTGHWNLSPEVATSLLGAKLEQGYLAHSYKAVSKLLRLMRGGVSYATAMTRMYGQVTPRPKTRLPLVRDAYPYLSNPLVNRCLSELRKLIHAILKAYGKPEVVRIELHRHLQMGPKARKLASYGMRVRQGMREKAAKRLVNEAELGITDPTPWQVDRVLLADECNWTCSITQKTMSWRSLMLGETFPIAHIIPFGMSLDDGWNNKMLVHASVLERRGTSLFSEMFPDQDGKIAARIQAFPDPPKKGDKKAPKQSFVGQEKLRRFRLTREDALQEYGETYAERFTESSSYAARLAAEYLGSLGLRVEATRSRVSSYVREAVGLSRLRRESLGDYRHAVLDAVSVAMTTPKTVRALCAAAKMGERRRFGSFPAPWPTFVEDAREAMHTTIVSHRSKRRVRGQLHQETNLGHPKSDAKGVYHLLRRPLASITKNDIKGIAGKEIREVIEKALGTNDPKTWFADPQNLPLFHGNRVRYVRVIRRDKAFPVGQGVPRYVTNDVNHHAIVRASGKTWTRDIVNRLEAQRRLAKKTRGPRRGELSADPPIYEDGILTMAVGETFVIKNDEGKEELVQTRAVNHEKRVSYVRIHDCRTIKEMGDDMRRETVDCLRQRGIRKVHIDILGRVRRTGQKK